MSPFSFSTVSPQPLLSRPFSGTACARSFARVIYKGGIKREGQKTFPLKVLLKSVEKDKKEGGRRTL
jgi:hypothetical protein